MSKYNWTEIQKYYNEGHTFADVHREYGIWNKSIASAIVRGDFVSRPRNVKVSARKWRTTDKCEVCGKSVPKTRIKFCTKTCGRQYNGIIRQQLRRDETKKKLIAAFGGSCGICKLIDHHSVYDFHHLDPMEKEGRVLASARSWGRITIEAMKCVLLCVSCHRKVHAGVVDVPENIPRFIN
jgi:hypothetical protein